MSLPSPHVASRPRRRGSAPAIGLAAGLIGALATYFVGLRGTAADAALWGRQLPPDTSEALDTARSELSNGARTRLDETLKKVVDPATATQSLRLLSSLVTDAPKPLAAAIGGELSRQALTFTRTGEGEIAVRIARAATSLAGEDWRPWARLADVHVALGQSSEATEARLRSDQLHRLYPSPTTGHYVLGIIGPIAALVLGVILGVLLGRRTAGLSEGGAEPPATAGPLPTAGVPEEPEFAGKGRITRVLGAEERLDQAQLLLEEGEWEDAVKVFRKAVSLNPALAKKVAGLCIGAGKRLYELGKLEAAEHAFELAIEFDANDIRAHTYLANCMVKRGDFAKATEHYLHVCSIDSQGAVGFYNLGICYEKTQQFDHAVRAFDHALTQDPNLANAHFYLGKIHENEGRRDAAIVHWKACVALAPGSAQGQRAEQRLAVLAND